MKVAAAASLVLILSLGASGLPFFQWDLAPQADKAIHMSLEQVNSQYGRERLFKLTKGSVKRVVSLGMNTHDLIMNFAVRETDCLKTSGADPLNCNFRRGFFVSEASCYSRVRITGETAQVVGLRCSQADSSSSSESSEEIGGRTWVYNPFAPRAPVNPPVVDIPTMAPFRESRPRDRSSIRGDNFNNHLEQF